MTEYSDTEAKPSPDSTIAYTRSTRSLQEHREWATSPRTFAAQKAAIATSEQFTADGTPVRYIRSTFVPSSGACMCLFEAGAADDVKRVNEKAKIPFDRITEALDLTP